LLIVNSAVIGVSILELESILAYIVIPFGPIIPNLNLAVTRLATTDGALAPSAFLEQSEMRLSKEELLSNSGLTEDQLVELESYGLIEIKGRHYDGDALIVAKVVAEIAVFGIEGRHLRAFKTAADREVGLVEQVITPLLRQKNPESKARAQEVSREIASLSVRLHSALVRSGLNRAR